MIWKRQNLKIRNRFGKDAKNNRSDSKHGTFRKYGQPPIDTPEETSAIPFKKMKPKNEAYNILYIRKKWLCNKIGYTEKWKNGFCGKNKTIQIQPPHPFWKKKIIRPEKQQGSTRRKAGDWSELPLWKRKIRIPIFLSTALKGWDVWVGNKVREHIILQDDAWTNRMPDSAANER